MLHEIFSWIGDIPPNVWGVVFTIWLLIAVGNSEERDDFMKKTWLLLTGPSKLEDYSDEWLQQAEKQFRSSLLTPIKKMLKWIIQKLNEMTNKYQWKLVGQFVLLSFLPFFFIADAIAIYNILDAMGLPVERLPDKWLDLLAQYGLAVAAGTFFSVVVAGFVLFEIFGNSEFSDFGNYSEGAKRIVKGISVFLMVSSLTSGISLGFVAWKLSGNMPVSLNWTENLVWFSRDILVRANVLISTAVILLEAMRGLRTVIVVLLGGFFVIVGLLEIIFGVIGAMGRIFFDLASRFVLWGMWLVSFMIFAPFDVIKSTPKNLIEFLIGLFQKSQ